MLCSLVLYWHIQFLHRLICSLIFRMILGSMILFANYKCTYNRYKRTPPFRICPNSQAPTAWTIFLPGLAQWWDVFDRAGPTVRSGWTWWSTWSLGWPVCEWAPRTHKYKTPFWDAFLISFPSCKSSPFERCQKSVPMCCENLTKT
jgi:hypothetical protein